MTNIKVHDQLPTGETVPLDVALEQLTNDPTLSIYGHGTPSSEFAAEAIRDGLQVRDPYLSSTAIRLASTYDPNREDSDPLIVKNPDAVQRNRAQIKEWPHKEHNFVVILGVENIPPSKKPPFKYQYSILQDRNNVTSDGITQGHKYGVDPRFVAGYFDARAQTFTPNPNFDPHYDPELYASTADMSINMSHAVHIGDLEDDRDGEVNNHLAQPLGAAVLSGVRPPQDDEEASLGENVF